MLFAREREMTGPVLDWLHNQGLVTKVEFDLPWGICDLVGLSFNEAQVVKRLSFGQRKPVGPMHRVELLRQIPDRESGKSITMRRLRRVASESVGSADLDRDLTKLIADGFVIESRRGAVQKVNGWAPLHERIVAVELKLLRISEAVSQASSNRAFATESYIALPIEVAHRLVRNGRYSDFKSLGIGVLGVSRDGCKVISPVAPTDGHDATLQMHCVERFWRTRGN